jgi:acyl-CoA synthetase (AMP-forming)/AMP-acid ligase II
MCCTITATNRHTKSSNIGKPFPTASFFVLSRRGEYVVPIFGSGELCIGGPQVAREYHNNIQLTKRQFIQLEGGTVYRTGDLVRMLGDGTFEFLGRADDQVKIRGLRVELDEISSVLRSGHRDIKDATTIVVKHSEGAKEQLVSFLAVEGRKQHGSKPKVLKAGSLTEEIQSSALKAARAKLPRYMIPAVILIIDHVPRSAAGKVDKKTLGAFFREQDIQSFGAAGVEEDESVWTEEEKKIRSVFSQISRVPVEQISRNSTIYEIGLDSISAAQVAMQLKRIGLEISVLDILEVCIHGKQEGEILLTTLSDHL